MHAIIFRNKINVVPLPQEDGYKLHVLLRKALDEYSLPHCYASIYKKQKIYELPCDRKNIRSIYVKKN